MTTIHVPPWTNEHALGGLRFVERDVPAVTGARPLRILQQEWLIETYHPIDHVVISTRTEWRDVPLVEE